MKDVKLKYIKPEFKVVVIDNLVSLQTSSDETPGGGGFESQSAPSSTSVNSTNPFEENSFKEQ